MSDSAVISPPPGGSGGPDDSVDIERELAEIAGILNAQHGRLVAVVQRALASDEWRQSEVRSPAQWLAWKTGLSTHRAKEIVRCAERRAEFPCVTGALDRGELAVDQVIAAVEAPAWADERIAEFATVCTVTQLRKTMKREFFDEGELEPADDPAPEPTDRLSTSVDADGRWRITGSGDVDRGAIVDAALAEAKDSLFERGDTEATWFDALVEVCERSLDAIESPARRDRFRTWVHLDAASGCATTTDGHRIPKPILDQLLCDSVVQPVWERDGVPVSVGRTQRIVPDRTRRLIERRDCGCRVPGCTNSRFVEIHHIIHWRDGGPTDTSNLISLCGKHHRAHHQGRLGIAGNADEPDGVRFTDVNGRSIERCGRPKIPDRPPDAPVGRYDHPVGGRFDYGYFTGWVHPDVLNARRTRHHRE